MSDVAEVVSQLRDAIIVLDPAGKVVDWLGAAEHLFGWDQAAMIGADINERFGPRDANGSKCSIGVPPSAAKLRTITGTPEQEYLVKTRSGEDLWVGITCSFARDANSKISRTIAVVRDITRRKGIDLAKSEVISAVSHELRSPLTSVKGFTSTLLNKWDRFDDETKKHLLFTINTDADRVTRLINELLDFSRLEAGRLQLRRQRIAIPDIAHRVIDRIQPRAEAHKLTTEFPDDFPETFADPDKVEQVLTNLVENAVKYTDSGEVKVSGAWDDATVSIWVSDQGDGIPLEHRSQVFGKFFRRGERAGNPTGTGLGLYISKGLLEAHGGRIWVDEAPGGGAVFTFTLPRSEP
ncbi:MAG: ATP-binding protein [Actinomycetota bacterium]|nr:PAS domain-containing sensor histidine kinase [Actinomycetota bacterium]